MQLVCYCDYEQVATVLQTCTTVGGDLQLPFDCPTDHLMDPGGMEAVGLDYRLPRFFSNPLAAPLLSKQVGVQVLARGASPASELSEAGDPAPSNRGALGVGMKAEEVVSALQPLAAAPLLVLRGLVPHTFGGFASEAENARFDEVFWKVAPAYPGWCCSGHMYQEQWPFVHFDYAMPPGLAASQGQGMAEWQPPHLERPAWCDDGSLDEENAKFAKLPNHPCVYLTSAR
jgi:hypothetical protein